MVAEDLQTVDLCVIMGLVVKGLVREVWLVGCVLRCLVCGRDEAELRRTDEDEVDRSLQGKKRASPPPGQGHGTCLQRKHSWAGEPMEGGRNNDSLFDSFESTV